MIKETTKFIEQARDLTSSDKSYGLNGLFLFLYLGVPLKVVVSDGEEWDHVSISCERRTPTWDEICYIKNLFFRGDEWVVQYHPEKSKSINNHPNVLHLWRSQKKELPKPPLWMV